MERLAAYEASSSCENKVLSLVSSESFKLEFESLFKGPKNLEFRVAL